MAAVVLTEPDLSLASDTAASGYEWRRPLTPFTAMLMELADYPMMRWMLLGIRERGEARR
ncbi:hypothetical protein [Streptosporangium sp. NPDC001681]|uniref:hypothetical protein n=1 Tax=Streptosporangium sp. NPDC001681 TaxID=3154395 RepID=UPI00332463E0